jgi:hypothetical protein
LNELAINCTDMAFEKYDVNKDGDIDMNTEATEMVEFYTDYVCE